MFGAEVAANASQSVAPPRPPVNVTVTEPPRATDVVLTVSVGGGVILNATAFDVPPPGAGVKTVTCRLATQLPGRRRRIVADTRVDVKYVVVRGEPFQCTTDVGVKVLPLTISDSDKVPATAALGFSDVMTAARGADIEILDSSPRA